jgi:hypothetical protein
VSAIAFDRHRPMAKIQHAIITVHVIGSFDSVDQSSCVSYGLAGSILQLKFPGVKVACRMLNNDPILLDIIVQAL